MVLMGSRAIRGSVVACLTLALLAPTTALAQEGSLSGFVLDPEGNPATGFRLIFQEPDGGAEFTSPPSDDLGRYRISLPAGKDYVLVAAIAPDGARLDVPSLPPIPVEVGMRRLDVGFQAREEKPARRGKGKKPKAATDGRFQWWHVGGIVGAVLVFSVTVLDDDEPFASPSAP